MARKKLPGDAACPCGTGKQYSDCCDGREFEWLVDDDGTVLRSVPLSPEALQVLAKIRSEFTDRMGREPGPDDRVFDGLPHQEHVEHVMVQAMQEAGIDPAVIYAFEETGLIVSEENQDLISEADLEQYYAAIEEYYRRREHEDAASLLPDPDVVVTFEDTPSAEMTPAEIKGMVINPIYAGIGPYPPIVSDAAWVENCKWLLEQDGAEQFLVNLLYVLRVALGTHEDFDDAEEGDIDDDVDDGDIPF